MSELGEAFRSVILAGYTPVNSVAYERLRAWLDEVGWPPSDWQPVTTTGGDEG